MIRVSQKRVLQALVDMTAGVLGAMPPEDALQSLADAVSVPALALGRIDRATRDAVVLVGNVRAMDLPKDWHMGTDPLRVHLSVLHEDDTTRTLMILHDPWQDLTVERIEPATSCVPYLATLWLSRTPAFERALSRGRSVAPQGVLHPDNPYRLTPTESRICALIAMGHRPVTMVGAMEDLDADDTDAPSQHLCKDGPRRHDRGAAQDPDLRL